MAISFNSLQSKMKQAAASVDLKSIEKSMNTLGKDMEAMARIAEKLPLKVGADKFANSVEELASAANVLDNIQTVTNTLGDFPAILNGVKPAMPLKNATTALENLQKLAPDLQRPIHEFAQNGRLDEKIMIPIVKFAADLKAITEGPIISGFNDVVIGLGTAQGIAASMKQTTAKLRNLLTEGDIIGTLETLGSQDVKQALGKVQSLLDNDIKDFVSGEIGGEFQQLQKNLTSALKTITDSPILDLAHDLNKTLNVIGRDFGISEELSKTLINTLKNSGVNDAISLLSGTGIPVNELESKLLELQRTATSLNQIVQNPVQVGNTTSTIELSSIAEEWKRGIFRYVQISGEITGELKASTRDIDSVIIHWSETYIDQDIGAEELNYINNQGIPYHYVIRRDGSVQRGRNLNEVGAHTESSYDATSIGVVLIGGYPSYYGDENVGLSIESLTQVQLNSLEKLLAAIYDVLPGINVYGHGEIAGGQSVPEIEPGIDVKEYTRQRFNKTSDPIDTTTAPPRIENTPVPRPSSGTNSTGRVVESYRNNPQSIRDDPIQPDLKNILETVAFETNTTIYITSGGQLPNDPVGVPGGRTGGARHNYGWAADCLFKDANGKWLDFGTNNPSTKVLQVYNSLVSNGITGIGAGKDYMYSPGQGVHAIHLDIAAGRNPNIAPGGRWGKDRTSATAARYIK